MLNSISFSASKTTPSPTNKKPTQPQSPITPKAIEKKDTIEITNKQDPKQKIVVDQSTFTLLAAILNTLQNPPKLPEGHAKMSEGGGGTN